MIKEIEFFAHGTPKGQPRARAFARGGMVRMYDPGTAEGWKAQIAIAIRDQIPSEPIDVPIAVTMQFYFPRPKNHFGKRKGEEYLKPDAPHWHTSKPDADNAGKAVLDALTMLRVWRDDALVVRLSITKQYSDQPGAKITIADAAI